MIKHGMHIPQLEKVVGQIRNGKNPKVFLLHGEEDLLVDQSRKILVNELVSNAEDEFHLEKKPLEKVACDELLDELRSPLLFVRKRCFDLTGVPYFSKDSKTKDIEKLGNYLKHHLDPGSYLIFSTRDTVNKKNKLYTIVKQIGIILYFPLFDLYKAGLVNKDGMYPYVKSYLETNGKRILPDAYKELRLRKENNLYSVIQELDKLIAYASPSSTITLKHVDTIVPQARSDQVFKLTDAILSQDLTKAYKLLEELISMGTPVTYVIQSLARQFRFLIQARQLVSRSRTIIKPGFLSYNKVKDQVLPSWKKKLADETSPGMFPILQNHPFLVYKVLVASEKFSEIQLQQGLIMLREMDKRVKSSGGLPNHLLRELVFSWKNVSSSL